MGSRNQRQAKQQKHQARVAEKQQRRRQRNQKAAIAREGSDDRREPQRQVRIMPGMKVEQHGRSLHFDNFRTPEEHADFLQRVRIGRPTMPHEMKAESAEVERLLLKYDPFEMLAAIAYGELFTDPETFQDATHHGLLGVVEYAALLYLKHPFPQHAEPFINSSDVLLVREGIKSLFMKSVWYHGSEHVGKRDDGLPDPIDELRFRTILEGIFVRGKGYPHQLQPLLDELFRPFQKWLVSNLGFDVRDAIVIDEASTKLCERKWEERKQKVRDLETQIIAGVKSRRDGQPIDDEIKDFVEQLYKLPLKKTREKLRLMLASWLYFGLGSCLSFDVDELAQEAGLPAERVRACLDFFANDFGTLNRDDLYLPSPRHELTLRPAIRHEGRYMFPSSLLLLSAIQSRLEEALNPGCAGAINKDQARFNAYQDHRKELLEAKSIELIQKILPFASTARNLLYDIEDNGVVQQCELDGLAVADTTAFLIECKAGSLSEPARRGAPLRIEKSVKDLITAPHSQGLRTENFIRQNDNPVFKLKSGGQFAFDKTKIRRIVLINVTLDVLDVYAATLYRTAETGLFQQGRLPWSVCLSDLEVFVDMIEYPAQFIHYLERRLRLNEIAKTAAHDELDWLGHYLAEGLYFERLKDSDIDMMQLTSYSTSFDDYYFYKTGRRTTPAEKPVQKVAATLKQIILDLEKTKLFGYTECVCDLLNWDGDGQQKIARHFDQVRNSSLSDGQAHDFTAIVEKSKRGITVFSTTASTAKERLERLVRHALRKAEELGAKRWSGMLTVVDLPGLIQACVHIWRNESEVLEYLVSQTESG